MKSPLHSLIPFLPLFSIIFGCQLSVLCWNFQLRRLNTKLHLPIPELDSILILAAWDPRYTASRRIHRKHRFLYCCVFIHCFRYVFTGQLRSNEHWAYRERRLQHLLYCYVTSKRTWCVPMLRVRGHYLATAVSLPPQFLLWANTP
jgi:hypothetical protein